MADEKKEETKVEEQATEEQPTTEEEDFKDEEILFSDGKVGDIEVKPWSFGMLFDVSPLLDTVLQKAELNGLASDLTNLDRQISFLTLAKLFATASSEVLQIICLTTGRDTKEIKALPMDDGVKLATIIFNQNKETIKNALAPLFLAMA